MGVAVELAGIARAVDDTTADVVLIDTRTLDLAGERVGARRAIAVAVASPRLRSHHTAHLQ